MFTAILCSTTVFEITPQTPAWELYIHLFLHKSLRSSWTLGVLAQFNVFILYFQLQNVM